MGERERKREKQRERTVNVHNRLVCVYIYTGVPCIIICALCCSRCTSAKCMCRRSCRFTETTRRFGSGGGVREEVVVVVEKVEEGGCPGTGTTRPTVEEPQEWEPGAGLPTRAAKPNTQGGGGGSE